MKKLLTIALALVMVLALAAPAMATVGFGPQPETTPPTATEWSVKIHALEFIPATNGFTFENNYYADYDPTKGIVAGSDIRFVVDVTFPKTGDIADADMFERNLENMALVVSGNNLAFGWASIASILGLTTRGHEFVNNSLPRITTNSPTKTVYYMSDNLVDYSEYPFEYDPEEINTVYYMFNCQKDLHLSKYYTTTYSFMFVADVLKTADVTVTAIMSAAGSSSQFAKNGTYRFTYKGATYSVKHTANSDGTNYYDMWNEKDARKVVRFTTDSKDQITNVAVSVDSMVSMSYTSVTPLTYAELQAAGILVSGIAAGTDPLLVDEANAALYIDAAKALITTQTNATLTQNEAAWVNGVIVGAQYTAGTNRASVTDALVAKSTLAATKALFTTAGQALITYTAVTSVTAITEAAAWAKLRTLYTKYAKLVIGVPGDQIASAITGVPFTVTYTNSVPFLGWLGDASMNHGQWWNVNKDVRLSEIVFNLNDKVHTAGYANTNTTATATDHAAAVARVRTFSPTNNSHSTLNQVVYTWCAEGAFADPLVYAEKQNLYDEKNVTASKDVNKVMYNQLYPVFKEMLMTVLGFEWDGTIAYMYRAAFVEKFGGKLEAAASYTYAAYTSALVVADPNAQPPQTGDTTSILGFVMIAVAVLAAGAVVVKKVRA